MLAGLPFVGKVFSTDCKRSRSLFVFNENACYRFEDALMPSESIETYIAPGPPIKIHIRSSLEETIRWISVEERLPEPNNSTLAYLDMPAYLPVHDIVCAVPARRILAKIGARVMESLFVNGYGFCLDDKTKLNPTHWAEMPKGPQV
jgi:hypothetical protein